ncbi:hypothetical protein [Photorhabdus sp. SF281]|uniref:hypothetical protein n=1 Tax=Photorhabdus sp. SF281 TaxID=3459527 RepID=UPI004044161A
MKTSTDFEKIAGYLTVLEEQQAIVTDMINEMAEAKNDAFDAILESKASLNLATEALKQQLAELDVVKRSAINSLDMTALQFRELAKTVPNELGQNIMAIIQQTDIAGAVRQRTDAQMEAIVTQVDTMTQRGSGFVDKIASAERDLTSLYDQLKKNLWKIVGGTILSTALVTTLVVGLSAKFFFSARCGQKLLRHIQHLSAGRAA